MFSVCTYMQQNQHGPVPTTQETVPLLVTLSKLSVPLPSQYLLGREAVQDKHFLFVTQK